MTRESHFTVDFWSGGVGVYGPPEGDRIFSWKISKKNLTKFYLRKHFSFYLFVTARSKYGGLHQINKKNRDF